MKAVWYEGQGPAAEVLQFGELPTPQPAAGEVRVRLHWSGVNPSDVKRRAGLGNRPLPFPRVVPHSDGSGVIDEIGPGVPVSRLGERVWVWNAAWGRPHGTAAEYVTLPSRQAVRLPDGVALEAGACFGIPALTALHAVLGKGGVRDKTVLVAGGAGAVGHYAVQFARRLGARQVITTVSSDAKARIALQAGADVAVDYRREDVVARAHALTDGQGVDRVIEVDLAVNGELDAGLLRPGGDIMAYGSGKPAFTLPFFPLISHGLSLHFFIVYHLTEAERAAAEATLSELLTSPGLNHRIGARLPLAEIVHAHELQESGRAVGNVLLHIP